jgi:hypothetical protein
MNISKLLLPIFAVMLVFSLILANASNTSISKAASLSKPVIYAQRVTYNKLKVTVKHKVTNATSYKYYRSTSQVGGYKLIKTTSALSYYDSGLSTNTRYYYKIIAFRRATKSSASNPRSAKPTLNKIANINQYTKLSSIRLLWTDIPGASGYKVYRASSENGLYSHIANTSKRTYTNTRLSDNEDYWYRIKPFRRLSTKVVYGSVSYKKKSVTPLPVGVYTIKSSGIFILQTNGIACWERYAGAVNDNSGYDTTDCFYDKTYVYVSGGTRLEFDHYRKGSIKRIANDDDTSTKSSFSRAGMFIGGYDLKPGTYEIYGSDYYSVNTCEDLECDEINDIEIMSSGGYYQIYLGFGEVLDISSNYYIYGVRTGN